MAATLPAPPASPESALTGAVRDAVAYADIFDYPLTREEVWRFLPVEAGRAQVDAAIDLMLSADRTIEARGDLVFLRGRSHLPEVRREREVYAQRSWRRAERYARILWALPFVRMVGVTGALAMNNGGARDDIDFFLVTEPGRLWTARGFTVLLCRLARIFGDTLCPNYLLSASCLAIRDGDLYYAHELAQMVPLHGQAVAERIWQENLWCVSFLPNVSRPAAGMRVDYMSPGARMVKRAAEGILRSTLGERLESWERERKIARLTRAADVHTDEERYSADVCKGHRDGHGQRVMQHLHARDLGQSGWRGSIRDG